MPLRRRRLFAVLVGFASCARHVPPKYAPAGIAGCADERLRFPAPQHTDARPVF
jgi:hypothetical protein